MKKNCVFFSALVSKLNTGLINKGLYGMFFVCEVWCIADISSVSPSSEETGFVLKSIGIQDRNSVLVSAAASRKLYFLFMFQRPEELWNKYLNELKTWADNKKGQKNSYAPYGYDSMWVIAYALNRSISQLEAMNMSLSQFSYTTNSDNVIASVIKRMVLNTSINGMSVSRENFL